MTITLPPPTREQDNWPRLLSRSGQDRQYWREMMASDVGLHHKTIHPHGIHGHWEEGKHPRGQGGKFAPTAHDLSTGHIDPASIHLLSVQGRNGKNRTYGGTLHSEHGEHPIIVKVIPEEHHVEGYRDRVEHEAAASLINEGLGHLVSAPTTVIRDLPEGRAAVQERLPGQDLHSWAQETQHDHPRELIAPHLQDIAFFDSLIGNPDRPTDNLLVHEHPDGLVVHAIDHSLAFHEGFRGILPWAVTGRFTGQELTGHQRGALTHLLRHFDDLRPRLLATGLSHEQVEGVHSRAVTMVTSGHILPADRETPDPMEALKEATPHRHDGLHRKAHPHQPSLGLHWDPVKHPRGEHGHFSTVDTHLDVMPQSFQDKINRRLENLGISQTHLEQNLRDMAEYALGADMPWRGGERHAAQDYFPGVRRFADTLAHSYKVPIEHAVGVIAALSPRRKWTLPSDAKGLDNKIAAEGVFHLVEQERQGLRVQISRELAMDFNRQGTHSTAAGQAVNRDIQDTGPMREGEVALADLSPLKAAHAAHALGMGLTGAAGHVPVANAIAIARGGSPDEYLTGPKVRSFYNNIGLPGETNDVTVDTHVLRAALDEKPITVSGVHYDSAWEWEKADANHKFQNLLFTIDGRKEGMGRHTGAYAVVRDAVARVGAEFGLRPDEMQTVIWRQSQMRYLGQNPDNAHISSAMRERARADYERYGRWERVTRILHGHPVRAGGGIPETKAVHPHGLHTWEEEKHPRGEHGRFTSKNGTEGMEYGKVGDSHFVPADVLSEKYHRFYHESLNEFRGASDAELGHHIETEHELGFRWPEVGHANAAAAAHLAGERGLGVSEVLALHRQKKAETKQRAHERQAIKREQEIKAGAESAAKLAQGAEAEPELVHRTVPHLERMAPDQERVGIENIARDHERQLGRSIFGETLPDEQDIVTTLHGSEDLVNGEWVFGPRYALELGNQHAKEIAARSGLDQGTVRGYLGSWANSTVGPEATQLQYAVAEKFGLEPHALGKKPTRKQLATARTIVDTLYTMTQEHFQQRGITHLTLYRGIVYGAGQPPLPGVTGTSYTETRYHARALESWVPFETVAEVYTRAEDMGAMRPKRKRETHTYIAAAQVPIERILSTGLLGMGLSEYNEVVVIGTSGQRIGARKP